MFCFPNHSPSPLLRPFRTTPWSFLLGLAWLLSRGTLATEIALYNHQWHVNLDPETLALRVQPAGEPTLVVSEGLAPHKVSSAPHLENNRARWQWDQGQWQLQVELQGPDLLLTIQAQQPGTLSVLRQPAAAYGQGLILPLAEGHYIPRKQALWEDFLLQQAAELNTTQDLSLPLWGLDHSHYGLHWILTNPFNNQLTFRREATGLGLTLTHQFTPLAPAQPFTAILHLADHDRLAGAARYRRWLMEQGRFEPLAQKLQRQPAGKKLLGASHLYLWGNGALTAEDVRDWSALIAYLQAKSPFSQAIRQRLAREVQPLLSGRSLPLQAWQQALLIQALNQALTDWARTHWQNRTIDLEQLSSGYHKLYQQLVQHFGSALQPEPQRWGGGLSVKTIEQLQAAGLTHLWLSAADGWEGGLWHPPAVAHAVQAGYLVAPYDSYQTALPPGRQRDWATAHLGEAIHRQCGIIQADGQPKSGFQQQGYYTNPRCVRPFLQQRITRIQQVTGFNSWFLDCYATGMVFDDYRVGSSMTQATMAEENIRSMRWVTNHLDLVVGSEDSNATTAGGLLFAHGMQTPVIGWGDADLQKNRHSPHYLGGWYPGEQPTLFFKPTPLKEPYKTVHFDVRYRLPLYQTVFHDSVITTHHWLLDTLKLTNVSRENTLTQLLYNVPPLYHLNRATIAARLPLIQQQDLFFKPLHQRLATQALTGFRWLDEEGSLQQTQFADGTRLIANFGPKPQRYEEVGLPAYSVTALHADGVVTRYVMP